MSEVACGVVKVQLPDASDPTFWLMHDLAGLFGDETNRDAERRLKRSLRAARVRSVDVEAEADFVFVHARTPGRMVEVLRAIRDLARDEPFTSAHIDAAGAAMRAWRRPAPKPFDVGDVFAVPLDDDAFGGIQVLAFTGNAKRRGSPVVLVYDLLVRNLAELEARIRAGEGTPVAARQVLDVELAAGTWPRVGHRALPAVDATTLVEREQNRSGPVACILSSCLGVDPWEMFDPHPHEPYLLPGVVLPHKKRRREVFERRVREVFGDRPRAGPTEGAATLHIVLAYRGGAAEVPILEVPKLRGLLREVSQLERLELPEAERCVGGGFDGFFDVFAHVDDVARATARIDALAAARRLSQELYVERYAPFLFDWRGTLRRMR